MERIVSRCPRKIRLQVPVSALHILGVQTNQMVSERSPNSPLMYHGVTYIKQLKNPPDAGVITPTQDDSAVRANMNASDTSGVTRNDKRQVVAAVPVYEPDLPVLGSDGDVLSSVSVYYSVMILTVKIWGNNMYLLKAYNLL